MNRQRFLVASMMLQSTAAIAQYCPPVAIPSVCDPRLEGDPLDTAHGMAFYKTTDFTFRLSTTNIEFSRFFISSGVAWSNWGGALPFINPVSGIAKPFGSSGLGLRWWHSLYSFAYWAPSLALLQ